MRRIKRHDSMLPKVVEGNMFYIPSEDLFGFFMAAPNTGMRATNKNGDPISSEYGRGWGDEDFYMDSDISDAFYDKIRGLVFVYEAGLEMAYESDMETRLFTDYRAAKDYVETLEERNGFYTRFIDARILTTTEEK
jgi:hypothetical protein